MDGTYVQAYVHTRPTASLSRASTTLPLCARTKLSANNRLAGWLAGCGGLPVVSLDWIAATNGWSAFWCRSPLLFSQCDSHKTQESDNRRTADGTHTRTSNSITTVCAAHHDAGTRVHTRKHTRTHGRAHARTHARTRGSIFFLRVGVKRAP